MNNMLQLSFILICIISASLQKRCGKLNKNKIKSDDGMFHVVGLLPLMSPPGPHVLTIGPHQLESLIYIEIMKQEITTFNKKQQADWLHNIRH